MISKTNKSHAATFLNNKISSILSPIKNQVISSKTSEVFKIFSLNSSISTSNFSLSDDASQNTQSSSSCLMQINNFDKENRHKIHC